MDVKKKYRRIGWLSAEEMHAATLQWMSELMFVRDEQFFLNDLVKFYTLELTHSAVFKESKPLMEVLSKKEMEVVVLMKKVQSHENLLEILINEVDEDKMEKAYHETHRELAIQIQAYLIDYRQLKINLFKLVSKIMKGQKQKRLLN